MFPGIDIKSLQFGDPRYLWLLVVPAFLTILWTVQLSRRRRDNREFWSRRKLPLRRQPSFFGGLLFWLFLIFSVTFTIVALAEPRAAISFVRTAGLDLVILQDGSASMYTRDVYPDRWQRSMQFLHVLAESLQWNNDRIALALFAHIAAPQVRLTTDPNTFVFFWDHLKEQSPFPLQDDNTWDTNIELGVYWGVRLVEKDEQLHGRSANGKLFVLVSDGQTWSGKIDRALKLARARDIPITVIGVGTTTGGFIPEAPALGTRTVQSFSSIRATLDRDSLLSIARAGDGQYFELGRQSDRELATAIIKEGRSRAGSIGLQQSFEDLYWECLLIAALFLCLAVLTSSDRTELWLELVGGSLALVVVWTLTH